MMRSYLPANVRHSMDAGLAGPVHLIFDHFDLQIIQAVPQVKTPLPGDPANFRNSLGFKQLARGLHARFRGASICRCIACGMRHHQNKLGFRSAYLGRVAADQEKSHETAF